MELIERFINYCKVDTQSDHNSHITPSTRKQFDLAFKLKEELLDLGVYDADVDENCIVYGHIGANCPTDGIKIGFLAHMDTSPMMSDENCNPRIIENYDGEDIVLNKELDIVLSTAQFPDIKEHKGKTLIVTDGTTLLGADDKAGVAEIMNMVQYIHDNPDFKHRDISIAFTPDEEIGEGADHFSVKRFNADYAYTVDGGEVKSVDYENFNAASAKVCIHGVSIHPGSAKGIMVNSSLVAYEFISMLPIKDRPENTEGYEGFNHLTSIKGNVETSELSFIIRNHDKAIFEKQKADFEKAKDAINAKYGEGTCEMVITDTYQNMKEVIKDKMFIVDNAKDILKELEVEPVSTPIRGGTDGVRLSFMGLPCPNIGTGGRNFHGKYEYAIVEEMEIASKLIISLVKAD